MDKNSVCLFCFFLIICCMTSPNYIFSWITQKPWRSPAPSTALLLQKEHVTYSEVTFSFWSNIWSKPHTIPALLTFCALPSVYGKWKLGGWLRHFRPRTGTILVADMLCSFRILDDEQSRQTQFRVVYSTVGTLQNKIPEPYINVKENSNLVQKLYRTYLKCLLLWNIMNHF
jgi:hypothetical protein